MSGAARVVAVPLEAAALERRVEKHFYTAGEAAWALGTEYVVDLMEAAGWLRRVQGGRPRLYSARDVAVAATRLEREGLAELKRQAGEA